MPIVAKQAVSVAAALAIMALVGFIDYWTGYEISVFVLYAFPVAWIAWSVNLAWGVALSALATGEWVWADLADEHLYAHHWVLWERAVMNLAVFVFIAFSFHRFKRNLAKKSNQVRQLEGILPICIACKRISNPQGVWMDLDAYLRQNSEAQPAPCLCPDCLGARYR